MEFPVLHEYIPRARRRLGRSLLWLAMRASPEIKDEIRHDELTKLYTHKSFVEMFEKEITHNQRRSPAGAHDYLLFIDVDNFKAINDTLGHARGDEILCSLATGIQQSIRQEDFAGRRSGDEFLVGLRDVIETEPIIERMRQLNQRLIEEGVSVSIGMAQAPRGSCYEDIARLAEENMYSVKQSGGNDILWPGLS